MFFAADHIPDIFKFPDADMPIPYTELLITATPGYKKVAKGMFKRILGLLQDNSGETVDYIAQACALDGQSHSSPACWRESDLTNRKR